MNSKYINIPRYMIPRIIRSFIFIIIIISIDSTFIYSQQAHSKEINKIDSLLSQAEIFFVRGNLKESQEHFEKALEIDKNCVAALTGLGKICYSKNDFHDSKDYFDRSLTIDTSSKLLHYYCGIVNRDIAKFRDPIFLKYKSYRRAHEHFKWIFERDSLFLDALYQYAITLKYQDDYIESLGAILTQIRLRPELSDPYCGLIRTFHTIYDNKDIKDLENLISFSQDPLKKYLLGELRRRQGEFDESRSIFRELLNAKVPFPKTLIYISLLKIHAQKNEDDSLDSLYRRALNEITDSLDANMLFNDIKYIAGAQEIDLFNSISEKNRLEGYFTSFWNKRNPITDTKANPRLVEHYKRLVYAEKNYIFDREYFTFFKGNSKQHLNWKTHEIKENLVNRPDLESQKGSYSLNYEFTDLGLIYIRHGEPDEVARTGGYGTDPNESWLYHETANHPKMIFNFIGLRKFLIPTFLEPSLLGDRITWDPSYYQIINETGMDQTIIQDRIINKGKKSIDSGLTTENSLWNRKIKNIDLPYTLNTFKGKNYRTLVELAYLIPTTNIFDEIDDNVKSLNIETGFSFFNSNWEKIGGSVDTIGIERPQKKPYATIRLYTFNAIPDSCHGVIFFHPIGTDIYGNAKAKIKLPDYYKKGLRISDIEIAAKIDKATTKGSFNKNGLTVIPFAPRKYPLKKPLNLYFEIYNLSKNLDGKTIFQIEYTGKYSGQDGNILSEILSNDKSYSISTEYNRFGTEEKSIEYISIDVSKLEPGLYKFEVKIKDVNAQKTATGSCTIELVNPD
jgi:GWxTD domain-containing protein